jgi:hypothetical protein
MPTLNSYLFIWMLSFAFLLSPEVNVALLLLVVMLLLTLLLQLLLLCMRVLRSLRMSRLLLLLLPSAATPRSFLLCSGLSTLSRRMIYCYLVLLLQLLEVLCLVAKGRVHSIVCTCRVCGSVALTGALEQQLVAILGLCSLVLLLCLCFCLCMLCFISLYF